jgi:hypothetical protein
MRLQGDLHQRGLNRIFGIVLMPREHVGIANESWRGEIVQSSERRDTLLPQQVGAGANPTREVSLFTRVHSSIDDALALICLEKSEKCRPFSEWPVSTGSARR